MIEKLNAQDRRFILVCFVVTLVSCAVVAIRFPEIFPVSSVPMNLTAVEAREKGEEFLKNRQWAVSGYRHASNFRWERARIFLEWSLAPGEADSLYDRTVGWRWQNRWFIPGEVEEFKVAFTTSGRLAAFQHIVSEEASGDTLSQESALALAQFFLSGRLDWKQDAWDLVEANTEMRKRRVDHEFVWKKRKFDVSGASLRTRIVIQGKEVAAYDQWLKVPEEWEREYRAIRSRNGIPGRIWGVCFLVAILASLWTILAKRKAGQIRWRGPVIFALVVATCGLIALLNSIPADSYHFETSNSYLGFILEMIFLGLFASTVIALVILLVFAGSEAWYREQYPRHLQIGHALSARGIKTKSFLKSWLVAVTLVFLALAFRALWYGVGNRLGFWSPRSVPDLDSLNLLVPWVGVLTPAFLFTAMTEPVARLFAIPFSRKRLGLVPALLISGMVWSLGAQTDLSNPVYWNRIEAAIQGVLLAWAFHRFGFLTTLLFSFGYMVTRSSLIFFQSDHAYLVATALACLVVMSVPVLYVIVSYRRLGGFLNSSPLLNDAQEDSVVSSVERALPDSEMGVAAETVQLLGPSTRRVAIGSLVMGTLLMTSVETLDLGADSLVELNVTRTEALETAKRFLEDREIEYENDQVAARFKRNHHLSSHLFERGGEEAIRNVYTHHMDPLEWRFRFFRFGEIPEKRVYVESRTGRVSGFEFVLPDTTGLPSVSAAAARSMVESYFLSMDIETDSLEMTDEHTVQLEGRVDHRFTYSRKGTELQATAIHEIMVQGNRIGSHLKTIRIPERWERERARGSEVTKEVGFYALVFGFIGILAIWIAKLRVLARGRRLSWGRSLLGGLALALPLPVLDFINILGSTFAGYSTSTSKQGFLVENVVSNLGMLIVLWIPLAVLIISVQLMYPLRKEEIFARKPGYALNAILSLTGTLGVLLIVASIWSVKDGLWPTDASPWLSGPDAAELLPLLDGLTIITLTAFISLGALSLRYLYEHIFCQKRYLIPLILISLIACVPAYGGLTVFIGNIVNTSLVAITAIILIRFFWRDNVLNYVLGSAAFVTLGMMPDYLSVHAGSYRLQGIVLLGVMLLPVLLLARRAWQER